MNFLFEKLLFLKLFLIFIKGWVQNSDTFFRFRKENTFLLKEIHVELYSKNQSIKNKILLVGEI